MKLLGLFIRILAVPALIAMSGCAGFYVSGISGSATQDHLTDTDSETVSISISPLPHSAGLRK